VTPLAAPPGPAPVAARHRTALLVVVSLALMMVVSAVSGLNVALPDLAVDTGASQTQVTWIIDAYTVVFVGLLLPAGAIGDRYGRRGILLAGLVLFGAAAGAAMAVSSPATLIALRALMGAGAAAVMPATLSIVTTSFPPEERGRAVGVWVGVAGGGAVIGLFGSGLLLEFFSWSSFFGLNVALAVLAVAGTLWIVPTSRDAAATRLDPVGGLGALVGVTGIVFGIIEGPERGWTDPATVTAFAVGAAALVAFVLWELRRTEPMLDPRLFRLGGFRTGSFALTVQYFSSFGLFYIVLQYLQYVADLSPLLAATALLPLPLVLLPLSRNASRVTDRFGTERVVAAGLALSAAGMLVLSGLGVELAYWRLAAGLVLFAAGMGLAGTPATAAIVSSLPESKQGVGSAVNDTSRELGSALGIAVLGTVLNQGYRSGLAPALAGLPEPVAARAESSVSFVRLGADRLAGLGGAGDQLVDAARRSFVDATTSAFLVAAATLLAAAAAVLLGSRRRPRQPDRGRPVPPLGRPPAGAGRPVSDGGATRGAGPASGGR
jgi:EmrB/QacA subfamily drug resistance transporter